MRRWTPAHLHDQPLDVKLGEIRRRTREFFDRLFGDASDGSTGTAMPRMKLSRFLISVLAVTAILALYRLVLSVNNTTVALYPAAGSARRSPPAGVSPRPRWRRSSPCSASTTTSWSRWAHSPSRIPRIGWRWCAFLVTAVTASQLAERVRRRAAEAEERRLEIERLYELVQAMMLGGNARRTIREFVQRVVQVFGCDAAAFYYRPGEEYFRSGPESNPVTDHDLLAAAEVDELSVDDARTRATAPVRLGGHPLGSMALLGPLPSDQTLRAIVNLIAITDREGARHRRGQPRRGGAPERGIEIGAAGFAGARYQNAADFDQGRRHQPAGHGGRERDRELFTIINEEADRLNQLAAEVIAMARVEAGKLHLEKRPVTAGGTDRGARWPNSAPIRRGRPITVRCAAGLPPRGVRPRTGAAGGQATGRERAASIRPEARRSQYPPRRKVRRS